MSAGGVGGENSHKAANFAWLCTVLSFDAVALVLILLPEIVKAASADMIALARGASAALIPVIPLLLNNTVPQLWKARLVFWKWENPLPGSQAFSKFAFLDERINIEKLKQLVPNFPTAPREQNSLWYSIYQRFRNEVSVADAHKAFLLHRDLATLSVLLCLVSILVLCIFLDYSAAAVGKVSAVFVIQYVLTMLSARFSGQRFVCTVLAVYSTQGQADPIGK